ncbi:TIGR04139 family peptide modification target [Chryseobacterium oryctis]|uniref:TIGR04139 family peptide modification target n=1 Tax=Chryseobacterium oryctis TaxID=2952618 RepID=A0ABT3HQX1_9FLAO|nr:TIGR04139 family peptide modification target [Chryseobacterium oryctis]MCW3162183.1 TIGR04139 family peptide modification target [Chryseobacterium oryctis]
MKKLAGMKRDFSSLENKKLTDLEAIKGGNYAVQSNVDVGEGCTEFDVYDKPGGTYIRRDTYC